MVAVVVVVVVVVAVVVVVVVAVVAGLVVAVVDVMVLSPSLLLLLLLLLFLLLLLLPDGPRIQHWKRKEVHKIQEIKKRPGGAIRFKGASLAPSFSARLNDLYSFVAIPLTRSLHSQSSYRGAYRLDAGPKPRWPSASRWPLHVRQPCCLSWFGAGALRSHMGHRCAGTLPLFNHIVYIYYSGRADGLCAAWLTFV